MEARPRCSSRSIRQDLRWTLAAVVAAPLALFAASAWTNWLAVWRSTEVELARTADAAAEYARRLLEAQVLRIARANDVMAGLTDAEVREREPEIHAALRVVAAEREPVAREAFYLFVYDRHAAPLVASNLLPAPPPSPLLRMRDFNVALAGEDRPWVHVSQIHVGNTTSRAYFAVSGRRERSGNDLPPGAFDGVINASIYLDRVNPALQGLAPHPGDVVSLLRQDGAVLARSIGFPEGRSADGLRIPPTSPLLPSMARGDDRALLRMASSIDGVERFIAFRRVGGDWPVYASAGRDRAAIVAAWRRSLVPQASVALGSSVLLLLLAFGVARTQRALEGANTVLERRVEERTRDLRSRERLLRMSQAAANAAAWSWEPASGAVRWSPEMFELLGLDPEADAERESFTDFMAAVHPADRAALLAALPEALREGTLSIEFRAFRRLPDARQEERWILRRARVYPAEDGLPETLVGIDIDVTERHRAAERFEVATAAMAGFVYEWDVPSGRIDRTSGTAALVGAEVEPTIEAWRARVHPADLPRLLAEGAAVAADPGRDSYAVEYRVRCADGSWAWLLDRGRVTRDAATGAVRRLVGGAVDITARRVAEERQVLLLRELDHRARNALAVVKAAVRLTSRSDAQAFGAAVEGRIDALARAQTLLSDTHWSGTGLRELLEGALAPFTVPGAAPLAVLEGPAVSISASATQPLAMAVHELATNATKYGALSVPSGRLLVRWWQDDAALHLTWREEGGPPASDPSPRKGFGSRVVAATLQVQLGGAARWHWDPAGLRLEVDLPLARVAAGNGRDFVPDLGAEVRRPA
jgi:two-component sensor histidine kinase